MTKLILYVNADDVIVTTPNLEQKTVDSLLSYGEYPVEDFDRIEIDLEKENYVLRIGSRVKVN